MQSLRVKCVFGFCLVLALIVSVGLIGSVYAAPDGSVVVLGAAGACAVLSLVVALLLSRSVLSPLRRMAEYGVLLAGGDPAATFQGGCPVECLRLKQVMDTLAEEASGLKAERDDLESRLTMAERDLEAVNAAMEQAYEDAEAQKDSIIMGAAKLKELGDLLGDTTRGLSGQVDIVTEGATGQKRYSTESATAMEQMNTSILDVARNASAAAEQAGAARQQAVSGAELVNELTLAVASVDEKANYLKQRVNALGDQAEDIGQIMGVITDVADQTNLLALNAAIEAARAGEAGRGFAVVADEVRKLAEKTMAATKEVGDAVQGIQSGVRGSANEMSAASDAVGQASELAARAEISLKEIVTIVETSSDQAQAIAAAAEEQSAASEEITRSVDRVSETSNVIVSGMAESRTMIDSVSSYSDVLSAIIEDMADGDMTSIGRRDWSNLEEPVVLESSSESGDVTSPQPVAESFSQGVRESETRNASASLIQWSDKLKLGVEEIDGQHKRLVELVNRLHEHMKTGQGNEALGEVFDELKNYTVHHFATEEAIFEEIGYAGMLAHQAEHKRLVDTVLDLEAQFRGGKAALTNDVMRFLKEWLVNHIMGTDRKYVPAMHKAGIR